MNKGTRISALLAIILLGGCVFPAILSLYQGRFAGRTTPQAAADSPILVDGDGGWTSVTGITGDGSWGNPYIIKDKIIDAGGSGDGILIQNTTMYFTIRNCTVTHSASMPVAGIHLVNVTNGIIEQNNCSANGGGIFVEKMCVNITIRGNNATGNEYGIVVYDLSANVTVTSNNASANAYDGIYVTMNCTAVHVENNTAVFNVYEGIITYDNVTFSTVVGNNASWNGYEGLYISETFNTTFANNQILGNQNRGVIIFDGASNNTFDGNHISASAGVGVENLIGCKNNTFVRNNFTSNTGVGLVLNTGCEGNLIYLNRFESNVAGNAKDDAAFNRWDNGSVGNFWHDYTGIDGNDDGIGDSAWAIPGTAGSQDRFPIWDDGDHTIFINGDAGWLAVKIAGNCTGAGTSADPYVISGKTIDAGGVTSGIWIENSTAHFRVQDCRVIRSAAAPAAGIYLVNASNAVLMGNNCTNNEGPGILVSKLCENVNVIANNVSQNTLGYGVVISDRCVNVTIEGNEASFNGDGIIINSFCNDTIIRGNIIHGNPFEGVLVNVYCNNVTIEDNDIADNGNNGVHVFNSYFPVIRGNNCTGSGWHGIYLEAACHNATIENNVATGNARHGIFVAGGSRNATVVGNNASANTWSGIALYAGSNGSMVCNNSLGGNAGGNALDDSNFSRWDNDTRGNYWADYTGMDPDDDGMGDIPYAIPGLGGAIDHYPIWDDGDDVAPVITSTGLTDNQLWGPAAPGFTLEITEAYAISEAWVSYDGGAHNWTCGETGSLPGWVALPNGTVTATFWANDTAGHPATPVTVNLEKDSLGPLLTVKRMLPCQDVVCDYPGFDVNATDAHLNATWYTIGTNPTRYFFTGREVVIDPEVWAALPYGEVTFTFHANDTLGNEQVLVKTVTKEAPGPIVDGFPWAIIIGGGIALVVVAGVIIIQKRRKRRGLAPV